LNTIAPTKPNVDHFRVFRGAILNGMEPPATTVAILQAQGVDTGALKDRIMDAWYWRK
jgi:hypothetical protein